MDGRKGKRDGREEKQFIWLERKLRKEKENGGNEILCSPPFLFPSKLGVNDKEERVVHEELIFGVA